MPRRTVLSLVVIVLLGLLVWRRSAVEAAHEFRGLAMGTTFAVTVEEELSEVERERVRSLISGQLERIEGLMSTYDSASELSRVNRLAYDGPVTVGKELLDVLLMARGVAEASDGAFDVTVGPLVDAWGFGPGPLGDDPPDSALVAELRERVGFGLLVLDRATSTVRITHPETEIDLSGIAKGFAVDAVGAALADQGVSHALIEVGGELKAVGTRRDGSPWRVGIENPAEDLPGIYGTVLLRDDAIATSGDYRNFYETEGLRYAHIIDPRTGWPVPFTGASVSVVHEDAALADAWATALSVLGPAAGYEVALEEGLAALFVMRTSDGFESRATPRMADRVEVLTGTGES